MLKLNKLLYLSTDRQVFSDEIEPTPDQRKELAQAKNDIRDHLRPRIAAATVALLGMPRQVEPRFRTQGSWSYKTCVQPPCMPPQEMDWDFGVYLPVEVWEEKGPPHVMAKAYFELVEGLLKDLCKEKNWTLLPGKATCIRIKIASWGHIDVPLYAAPAEQFSQIKEAVAKSWSSSVHDSVALDESVEFGELPQQVWEDLDCVMLATRSGEWIGSHLAAALVRLGAGSEGGLLRLLDNDILGPENLGRHYLGYDALAQPKASKLRSDLLRQFPLASIEAVNADVVDCPSLFAADLVVDATGEEAVSEYLNETWLRGDGKVPVLYVWIKGNGECVQCLWTDKEELACFRCLKEVNPAVHRQDRFQVLKRPPTSKVLGCHSFTPYAVSAPMHATALAVDIICDWLEKGDPSPRFRTRKSENADLFPVENHNPLRLAGCPACLTS